MNYSVYIDESGEAGIENVRSNGKRGASPYMTLGGALIADLEKESVLDALENLRKSFRKSDLHCKNLTHFQILHFAKIVSELPVICFGVVSLKSTLGSYEERIDTDSRKYYNKCAQYFLECIGEHSFDNKIFPAYVDIIFEKGNFNYTALKNLVRKCQDRPMNDRVKLLQRIDADKIVAVSKVDEPLLALGDLVAHALYKCVDKPYSCYGFTEPRYLRQLKSKFYASPKSGKVIGHGIKPIHRLSELKLEREIYDMLFDW